MKLRELLESYNANPPDIDLYHWDVDDEAATMVECSLKDFTEAGLAEFADVLDAEVVRTRKEICGTMVVHVKGCKSRRVNDLCYAHAGHCASSNYRKWFTMDANEESGILLEDGNRYLCAAYPGEPRTFDWCEENCPKYYGCDTVALANDDLKIREGEAE